MLGAGTVLAVPNMSLEPREGRPAAAATSADNDRAGAGAVTTDTYISSQNRSIRTQRPAKPSDVRCCDRHRSTWRPATLTLHILS